MLCPPRRRSPVLAVLAGALALLFCAPAHAAPPALTPSVVGENPDTGDVFRFAQAVGVDPLDGSVFVGDQYSGRIRKFSPSGTPLLTFAALGKHAEPGRLNVVGGVAVDRSKHVYVLDSDNDRVSVFSAVDGRYLTSFGDRSIFFLFPAGKARPDHGIAASGLTVFQATPRSAIKVYVADGGNSRLEQFTLDPGTLTPAGPPRINAGLKLRWPQGVGVNPSGRLAYVADDQHHRVVVIDTRTMRSVRSVGDFGNGPGQFNAPYDVSIDNADPSRMYVADNLNGEVDVFDANTLEYVGALGGNGNRIGTFAIVRAVASGAGRAGGVLVGDSLNNRIQVVDRDGRVTHAWGVAGRSPGYVTRARGVAFTPDGGLAAADTFDHRVELFTGAGAYDGQYGPPGRTGFAAPSDGIDRFLLPESIAYDGDGDLWVADTGNHRVKRIDPDGTVNWISPEDVVIRPRSIAADEAGNAYVADDGQAAVLRITPAGAVSVLRGDLPGAAAVAVTRGVFPGVYAATDDRIVDVGTGRAVAPPPDEHTWNHPQGIAVADDGTMYVSEARTKLPGGARVVRGTPAPGGYTWDTIAAEGTGRGQVIDPAQLALSADDATLAVADAGNNRILRFDAPGHGPGPLRLLRTEILGGIERGSLASSPGGIDCGTDCLQHVTPGAHVTLRATAYPGSRLDSWTGACADAGTAHTCTVTVGTDLSVGVRFSAVPRPPVRILRISVNPTTWFLARRADRKHHRTARAATQAEVTVQLNEAAAVRTRLERRSSSGRFTAVTGGSTLRLLAGRTVIPMTTHFAGRAIGAGRYRLSMRARDEAGHVSVATSPAFTVRR